MKLKFFILSFAFCFVYISNAQNNSFPKKNVGYVHDLEHVFTTIELAELEATIDKFQKETFNEIAVFTVESIGNYTDFDKYALDLSNYWGIGLHEDGLTIVFSKSHRKIRISTGNGITYIITDEFCEEVIDKIIIPKFKNEEYYNGINDALIKIMDEWR